MTDKTDSKEREALVREICRAVAELPDRNSPEDWPEAMLVTHEELADIVRASLAASAGSEPMFWVRLCSDGLYEGPIHNARIEEVRRQSGAWSPLYLHPSPPEGMVGGWIALPGTLPDPGTPVLLDIGKKYPIRAMWAAKHTVQAADDDTDWGEYVEADDMYYAPEGWYEWNQCEDNHWRVTETPRAWAPLPPTTSAGSGKGE